MGQYLERYLTGECQPVWDELLAQGAAIRQEPLESLAWAVAQETMRRVRHNIELLIPRLRALGYRFGEIPPNDYFDSEEWEREFTKASPIFQPPPPETARVLDELEQRVGVLPLSIRAFYLEIGGVNFIGTAPWSDGGIAYDPLFMWPLANRPEGAVEEQDLEPGEEGGILFSPDRLHKYHYSGAFGYYMTVPNASIDGVFDVYEKTTFVEYLRISLRSGGLSGLEETVKRGSGMKAAHYVEKVEHVLAYLREGLLPI